MWLLRGICTKVQFEAGALDSKEECSVAEWCVDPGMGDCATNVGGVKG